MKNLYIHIPFCQRKCDYCAFYSETSCSAEETDLYLNRMASLIAQSSANPFETIYIGGGTPTLLTFQQLEKLLKILHKYINFQNITEFSIESNPETLDEDKILLLQDYAVSRLSIGVQSFKEKHRLTLGRHTRQEKIEKAVNLLRKHPFKHFNIDLIYAIPGQSIADFSEDLQRVCDCGCDHFSAYNLTIEEQTALAANKIIINEDTACMMYETAGNFKPFHRYEISNYALSTQSYCRHNCNIWQGDTLLGLGPSAASFDGIDRHIEVENLHDFLSGTPPETDRIPAERRQMEIFAVNLRTVNGWTKAQWEKKFPFSWNNILQKSRNVAKLYPGCWHITENHIKLSDTGLLFWNEISMELL